MFAGLMLWTLGQGLGTPIQSAYPVTELEVHTLGLVLSLPLQLILLATVTRFSPPCSCPIKSHAGRHASEFVGSPGVVGGGGVANAASLMRRLLAGEPSDPVGMPLAMLIESSLGGADFCALLRWSCYGWKRWPSAASCSRPSLVCWDRRDGGWS